MQICQKKLSKLCSNFCQTFVKILTKNHHAKNSLQSKFISEKRLCTQKTEKQRNVVSNCISSVVVKLCPEQDIVSLTFKSAKNLFFAVKRPQIC